MKHNPQIQQTSLAELHRLSITLSNLYDVAPTIINRHILPYQLHQKLRNNNKQNRNRVHRLALSVLEGLTFLDMG